MIFRFLYRCAALIPVILNLGCSTSGPAPRPNVIVVMVDTLRSDHLGCYGYKRATSPSIDALAGRGILIEHAASTSSWTLPAVASLFTSLYPGTHGLVSNDPLVEGLQPSLPEGVLTLAEVLENSGYATAAVTTNVFLNPSFHLDQGFQAYAGGPLSAREVVEQGLGLFSHFRSETGQPVFLYLHMNDIHGPYHPPAGFENRFRSETRTPLTLEDVKKLGYLRNSGHDIPDSTGDWLERYIDLYDGTITSVDEAVGSLLEGIRSMGCEDSTLVLFLSDHGEKFLEHGGFDHGYTLYDVVIEVPMIAVWPGRLPAGRRLGGAMSMVDVMPTLLDLCGVGSPDHLEGRSRAAEWRNGRLDPDPVYAELNIRGPYRIAERSPERKWILDASRGELVETYDLVHDPKETRNLIADPGPEGPEAAARLARFLQDRAERRKQIPGAPTPVLDRSVREALQRLGYVR